MNKVIVKQLPELENLVVIPTTEEQKFKSKKHGYDEVTVKEIETEDLEIVPSLESQSFKGIYGNINVHGISAEEITIKPSMEEQVKEGLFNKVNVSAIEGEDLVVAPTKEEQSFNGLYNNVKVQAIEAESLIITPTTEKQIQEGLFDQVTVNAIEGENLIVTPSSEQQIFNGVYTEVNVKGDSNLIAENIKEGTTIFGVEGTNKGIDTSDATVTPNDILQGKTAYENGEKIEGNIQEYKGSSELHIINTEDITIETMKKYLTENIVIKVDTEETTIVPSNSEQIKEGLFNKVTVSGDNNLKAENIKSGVSIFGVTGIVEEDTGEREENVTIDTTMDISNFRVSFCLTEIKELDLSKYTDLNRAFLDLTGLERIGILRTAQATNMVAMFSGCEKLKELPKEFDTSNVEDMTTFAYNCSALTKVNLDIPKCTDIASAFYGCKSLTEAELLNTGNITTYNSTFSGCTSLETVNQLDFSNANNASNVFYRCSALINVGGLLNYGKAFTQKSNNYTTYTLSLSNSTKITHDSLMNIINSLYDLNLTYDVANGGTLYTQKLTIGTINKNKLTANEIAIATSKGWTIS